MLLPFLVSLLLVAAGVFVVAKIARLAMRRLGLELDSVLLWLGVAEAPADGWSPGAAAPGDRAIHLVRPNP